MPSTLSVLRFLLIIAAAVSTIYTGDIKNPMHYIFLLLLFLLVTRLGDLWKSGFVFLFVVGEIAFASYLQNQFGGMLYLLFFPATLGALYSLHSKLWRILFCFLAVIAMNITLQEPELQQILYANLLFVVLLWLALYTLSLQTICEADRQLIDEMSGKRFEGNASRKRLMEYAKRIEGAAQVEERNRIAREIHDELGHKLIRMKLMMDAVVELQSEREDKGAELTRQVRGQLSDAMDLLRATVRKLKPEDEAIYRYSLNHLVEEFGESVGVKVHYEQIGISYEMYPSEEVLLYRNAREAIANAVRHGRATEVWIVLQLEPKRIVFQVSNDGILPADANVGRGFGFKGMEERAAVLGGVVTVEASERFCVTTIFPHRRLERSNHDGGEMIDDTHTAG